MKRVLYVSNILAHINSFHKPYIKMLREQGYAVDVLTNANGAPKPDYCDELYDVCIERSPFRIKNLKAIKIAKKIIRENNYSMIHVHTPMGATVGRIAAIKSRRSGTKVIYTSHGFHFYDGAPMINWLLYYPMEKYLARFTDCIITINHEDYKRAKKIAGPNCKVEYVNGVGVELERFCYTSREDKTAKKEEYGFVGKTVLFYAAEFITRKNHEFLIKAFKLVHNQNPNTILALAGVGPEFEKMKILAKDLGLGEAVKFLGYRKDVPKLLSMCDIVVSSSRQEGFPINLAEAVATGVPCVVSDIRGNVDVIKDGVTGFVYKQHNEKDFCDKVLRIINDSDCWNEFAENCKDVAKEIDVNTLTEKIDDIYLKIWRKV